jgi:hypothetical protein
VGNPCKQTKYFAVFYADRYKLGSISATFQPLQKMRSWIFFLQKGGMVEKERNPTDMHLAILNEKNALRDKNEPFATYFVKQNYIFEYLQRLTF